VGIGNEEKGKRDLGILPLTHTDRHRRVKAQSGKIK